MESLDEKYMVKINNYLISQVKCFFDKSNFSKIENFPQNLKLNYFRDPISRRFKLILRFKICDITLINITEIARR